MINVLRCIYHESTTPPTIRPDHLDSDYYSDVLAANRLNRHLLAGTIDPSAKGIMTMTGEILQHFEKAPVHFRGGFGVGFPYHSLGDNGQVATNPEFSRYLSEFDAKLHQEMAQSAIWPCVPCQSQDSFRTDACAGCTMTDIKPRTVMRAMPDIDILLVVDETDESTRQVLWETAQIHGCTQSDFDAFSAVKKAHRILESFEEQSHPQDFLPLDLHIVSRAAFLQTCEEIQTGMTNVTPQVWSMYADWKDNHKIDFWFDFVFSMTPYTQNMDNEVLDATNQARSGIASRYSTEEIINIVRQKSRRARVLLQHPVTRDILETRIDSWRKAA